MLILIAILLALLPAIAILYPFLGGRLGDELVEDESAPRAELERRWEATLAGLKSTELEHALGNLVDEDYTWLRERYMLEAAQVLKAMELEFEQEEELLANIALEIQRVRIRNGVKSEFELAITCPNCAEPIEMTERTGACQNCGNRYAQHDTKTPPSSAPPSEPAGE